MAWATRAGNVISGRGAKIQASHRTAASRPLTVLAAELQAEPNGVALPEICVNNRQLRDVSDDALSALQAANDPPFLFVRGQMMVAVLRDEKQRQVIGEVNESALRGRIDDQVLQGLVSRRVSRKGM